jgi:uncharacterized protein
MTVSSKGAALVTGASSGIGAAYADRLALRGHDLILVARDRERLEPLARRIGDETGREAAVLAADLSDPGDLAEVERVLRDDPAITVLVNNAGVGATAPLLESGVGDMSRIVALNVVALTRLTFAAAPAFVARGSGTVINIASVVAVAPETLRMSLNSPFLRPVLSFSGAWVTARRRAGHGGGGPAAQPTTAAPPLRHPRAPVAALSAASRR